LSPDHGDEKWMVTISDLESHLQLQFAVLLLTSEDYAMKQEIF